MLKNMNMDARKYAGCLLFLCLLLGAAQAQVKFSTVINSPEIGKDDYLEVTYSVANASSVSSLTPPNFTGFTIVSGPMEQNSMSLINGAVTKAQGVTYVLKPAAIGRYTIAGATAVVDGHAITSNPVMVKVTNAAPNPPSQPGNNPFFGFPEPEEMNEPQEAYILRKGDNAAAVIKKNLLVTLDVNKTTCYVGEPIVAVYKLYSRLRSESRVTKRPSLSQFSVYDMLQPEANNPTTEKRNGQYFTVHVIRKVQLYPLQDGSFVLDPVEVDNTVSFLRLESGSSKTSLRQLLDGYMSGMTDGKPEEHHITIGSLPVTITVKPLPAAGRPADFDGAVGKFSLAATVSTTPVKAGETAIMQVKLQGAGNMTLINAPVINWPAAIEGYEPTVKDNLDKTVAPIAGEKRFEYSFTVKQKGTLIIPPVTFSYFDPESSSYKTLRTAPDTLTVTKGSWKPRLPIVAAPATASADVSLLTLVYRWWWLLPLLLLVTALAWWLVKRKKIVAVKPAPAVVPLPETARDPFAAAKKALESLDNQAFYRGIAKAVWQVTGNHFRLSPEQLSREMVRGRLSVIPGGMEATRLMEDILRECELALYSPVQSPNEMRHTLDKAERYARLLSSAG